MTRQRSLLLWLLVAACAAPRPPAPVPSAPPPASVEEPGPPPLPPKCKVLEEPCISKGDTKAEIGATSWTIAPPEGWKFAEGDDVVAVSESAALGVTSYEKPTKARSTAARDAALRAVAEKIEVLPPKKLAWPKRPHKMSKIGSLEVALYQFGGAKRNQEVGPLLVFTAPLSSNRVLIGAAFVSEHDTSNADGAVLKAIESLSPNGPAPSGEETDTDAGTK